MASRWSSEHVICEFKDLQATAMAVDCRGQYALLGGRRALALLDLDKPSESVKRMPRQSKWDVNAVQWNPHESHTHYFVLASSQRADIHCWDSSGLAQQGSLKAHTRVISDVDWSPSDPYTIATCSVDTFTYLWDIRDCRKPRTALQAVAGASQVKWNKVSENQLATTHDGDIRIWDPRKGTSPVQYIAGHLSKIHGLDWSRSDQVHLATSSQDCTVKLWDVTSPKQAEAKLPMSAPVWRARYTPFGQGLVTVVVPQLRRGENSLLLWSLDELKQPIHTFMGHKDVVLEFQWRKQREGEASYQLVTWGRDYTLRIWEIDPHMQKLCGHDVPEEYLMSQTPGSSSADPSSSVPNMGEGAQNSSGERLEAGSAEGGVERLEVGRDRGLDLSRTPPPPGRKSQELLSPQQPKSLRHEFQLVNIDIPNVTVHELDELRRTCRVSAVRGSHYISLTMQFPKEYPNNSVPSFQIGSDTSISKTAQKQIIKSLQDLASWHVKHNRSCLEPCLRMLMTSLDNITQEDGQTSDSDIHNSYQQLGFPFYPESYVQDMSVPFPRTSGARFCGAGYLVCFTRKKEGTFRRISSSTDVHPRAITAVSQFVQVSHPQRIYNLARSPPRDNTNMLSNYYEQKDRIIERGMRRPRNRPRRREAAADSVSSVHKSDKKTGTVIIYDISSLIAPSRKLAEGYVINSEDVPLMCTKNSAVAEENGRTDLVRTWSLAALMSSSALKPSNNPDSESPWATHAFGRRMLKSLLDHYSRIYDVQTLAMLCCAFGTKNVSKSPGRQNSSEMTRSPSEAVITNYSPYHTIHPTDTSLKGWTFKRERVRRSNSLSDLYNTFVEPRDPAEEEKDNHQSQCKLLDPSWTARCDQFISAYGNLLYRWGLLEKRAEVLKYRSKPHEPHMGIEFVARCQHCSSVTRGVSCGNCKNLAFQCVICHVAVRGSSSFCLACGHGGHSLHMMEWFKVRSVCPTGCGCHCLQDNPMNPAVT